MSDNSQPRTSAAVWPPRRKPRAERAAATHPKPSWASKGTKSVNTATPTPSLPSLPPPSPPPPLPLPRPASPQPSAPLRDVLNRKRKTQFQNGWEATPKPPSYTPYALDPYARKRLKVSNAESVQPLLARRKPLSEVRWNALAHEARFIEEGQSLRSFQMQCANAVISRLGDVVVVAPTGAGKSLVWALPLLAVKDGICLVVTPYTSLGMECEQRNNALGITSVFIYADQRSDAIIESATQGHFCVIFVCPEMLESPTFAVALHSKTFQRRLLAVYIDEAHLVHEAADWRTSYERLHELRPIIGPTIPLIAISATLPASYQHSLRTHAGLRDNYRLINLGNFRPELSTVVIKLDSKRSSFDSLGFILPDDARAQDRAQDHCLLRRCPHANGPALVVSRAASEAAIAHVISGDPARWALVDS
ncbi:P-loop containing nucleoside triphosphate hydrolase protein [Irpex lacteus]|nr:P-loop containing nucleoside triphosphate hydrolase protein [Irpex lacteus]